jgi:hypothetical protein
MSLLMLRACFTLLHICTLYCQHSSDSLSLCLASYRLPIVLLSPLNQRPRANTPSVAAPPGPGV